VEAEVANTSKRCSTCPSPRITQRKLAALIKIPIAITVLMTKTVVEVEDPLIKYVALMPAIGLLPRFMGQSLVDLVGIKP
jgi:hypothetical protein